MTEIATAGPYPESFPADFKEIYIEGGKGVYATADALTVRYGRVVSVARMSAWAKSAGLALRQPKGSAAGRAQGKPSLRAVTLADVERAEASGEISRAPAREEEPLSIPFEKPAIAQIVEIPVPAEGYTFAELAPFQCRWCVSPNSTRPEDLRFCGKRQREGRPYCAEHVARAYVPASAIRFSKGPRL